MIVAIVMGLIMVIMMTMKIITIMRTVMMIMIIRIPMILFDDDHIYTFDGDDYSNGEEGVL